MRFPFVVSDWHGNRLSAKEIAFATAAGNYGLDVVEVTVSNHDTQACTIELKLDGKQRNLPAFANGAQLATHDGDLLAVVQPGTSVARQFTESGNRVRRLTFPTAKRSFPIFTRHQ